MEILHFKPLALFPRLEGRWLSRVVRRPNVS